MVNYSKESRRRVRSSLPVHETHLPDARATLGPKESAGPRPKSHCSDKLSPTSLILSSGNLGEAVTCGWQCHPSKDGARISVMVAKEKCRM